MFEFSPLEITLFHILVKVVILFGISALIFIILMFAGIIREIWRGP